MPPKIKKFLTFLTSLAALILLWQLLIIVGHFQTYILPSPWEVFKTLVEQYHIIIAQAPITIMETLVSLLLATVLGTIAAIFLSLLKPTKNWLLPLLILSQALPTFAIAPLFVIWFGFGISSKIAVTLLMIFFPITNSLYDGLRNTPILWLDHAHIMNASRFQTLWYIQLPAAMPSFASGLRYAAVIAPLGAILGEWVGASSGLGYLLLDANSHVNTSLMFATILVISVFTLSLYFGVDLLLKKLIYWSGH